VSTFSGLGTALSSLIAQRQALDVSGQNVANANTVGYTRQRAAIASLPAASVASMFSTSNGVGLGSTVTGIQRLSDGFLDARVRTETAGASYLAAQSAASTQLEKSVGEPSTTGLAAQLSTLWGAWGDLSNTTQKESSRAVLLESAQAVVDRVASLYDAASTQWDHARTTTVSLVDQVNTTATNVAELNARILAISNAGSSPNELMDERDQLVVSLSGLVGATTRTRPDGQLDVYVAGNPLVDGSRVKALEVTGPTTFAQATGGASVTVSWVGKPGMPVGLDGGRVAGLLAVTAPPGTPAGSGGMLTEAAASYDALAQKIHDDVNAIHSTATRTDGVTPGGDFFVIDAGKPPALGFRVAITDPAHIAVADATKGALDGSKGDAISRLGDSDTGPDASWAATVVRLGVRTASAASRANVAETSRAAAASAQLSQASVDTDEEAVNMLAYQRAYEGAARVLTAIDQMLDTLINRTGVVGR
jgi:flagellar hook-associated protein 1 FlgK